MQFLIQDLLIVSNRGNITLFKHTTPFWKVNIRIRTLQIKLRGQKQILPVCALS